MKMDKNKISRRKLLVDAGKLAAGAAIGFNIVGTNFCMNRTSTNEIPEEGAQEVIKGIPEWPWPYTRLDPEEVRKKGHLNTYEGGCCYGAFAAILHSLREKVGFPFTQIPAEIMFYGRGGLAHMESLCGALNGAAAAITLVSDNNTYEPLVKQLANWYTTFPFPSDLSNQYARNHTFLVDTYKSDKILIGSVANSILCSDSVANWCKKSGFTYESPERIERCCRLVGDVAAQAVIILNQQLES
jgi:hypothetical protein